MTPRLLLLAVLAAAFTSGAAGQALGGVTQTPGSDANLTKAQLKASFIRHHGFWDVCAFREYSDAPICAAAPVCGGCAPCLRARWLCGFKA